MGDQKKKKTMHDFHGRSFSNSKIWLQSQPASLRHPLCLLPSWTKSAHGSFLSIIRRDSFSQVCWSAIIQLTDPSPEFIHIACNWATLGRASACLKHGPGAKPHCVEQTVGTSRWQFSLPLLLLTLKSLIFYPLCTYICLWAAFIRDNLYFLKCDFLWAFIRSSKCGEL